MVTSAMLRTWAVRFDAIRFTDSVRSFHTPVTSGTCAWPPSLPSVPTSRATRVTSEVNTPSCLIMVLTMVAELQEFALQRAAVDVEMHGLEQVALRHRGDGAGHFGGRPEQVVDQGVDRAFHLAPGAAGDRKADALLGLALLADALADPLELLRHALVGGDDLVEGVGDLAFDAEPVARQANRKVADPHRLQRRKQIVQLMAGRCRCRWSAPPAERRCLGCRGCRCFVPCLNLLALRPLRAFKRTSRAKLQRMLGIGLARTAAAAGRPHTGTVGPADTVH